VEIASAACEKDFVALREEEGGCSQRCVSDVDGSEKRIGCGVCRRLDVMQVKC
jgi:hypothetical protein